MTSNVTSAVKCEEDLFCGVNIVKDIDNMTDLEKKHLPVITAPKSVREGVKIMSRMRISKAILIFLAVHYFAISAAGTGEDVVMTFSAPTIQSFVLDSVDPNYLNISTVGAPDPNIILHIGKRYQVTVLPYTLHPFQVIAKADSHIDDTILLSMNGTALFWESDPNVAWIDDGVGTVEFTFTSDLYNAMLEPDKRPGYRCGVHSSNMRGNFDVCLSISAGDINSDCSVDFLDMALLASDWLNCDFADQQLCN